jgi:hypothetical protein
MRDRRRDLCDLAEQRCLESRLERVLQRLGEIAADHRDRMRQRALEFRFTPDEARLFQPLEDAVALDRDRGMLQAGEAHVLGFDAGRQAIAEARHAAGMRAELLVGFLEQGIIGDNRREPRHPRPPDLAIGHARQLRAEQPARGREHFLGARQRHAADEMKLRTRHRYSLLNPRVALSF